MQESALLVAAAAIAALGATAGLVAWLASMRSIREHRAATEQALRAKEEAAEVLSQEVARLDEHIVALRELDSIRFAQRYIDAKTGLEGRVADLTTRLQSASRRKDTLQLELERMLPDDRTRSAETIRLRGELSRLQQEANRLEQILQSLSEFGPIPADHVRAELARRRQAQIELRGRLDRLSLAGVAREAALKMLRDELENARQEERELERDLEIATSAAPVLDGLLGISADVADRLRDVQGRLGDPLRLLADSRRGGRFMRAIGAPRAQAEPEPVVAPEPNGAPEPEKVSEPADVAPTWAPDVPIAVAASNGGLPPELVD